MKMTEEENNKNECKGTESNESENDVAESQLTNSQATEGQVTLNDFTEGQASENQETEDKGTANNVTNSQQVENQASENQATESQVTENNVNESKASEGQVTAYNVDEGKEIKSQEAEDQASENQATESQVTISNVNQSNETDNKIMDYIYRILIVDDEKEVSSALRRTLLYAKKLNSEIITAENGEAALAQLNRNEFDLILADYRMPGMTGTEFLHKVRDKYPDIVRIIVTGYSDIEIIKEAINKAEIHYYIEKPWDNKNVRSIVYEALKRKTERDADKKKHSKQKILNWLMDIYNDVKSMGIDLSFIDQNIQIAKDALDSNNLESALTYINHSVNILKQFAEVSYPTVIVKGINDVQLPANKWSKLNLEINNIGNSIAKDIQLQLTSEFKIKEIETIPELNVNEKKPLTLEIFPTENGTFSLVIEILCTKPFDNTKYKFEEIFWVRVGDVAGKTKLNRRFGYYKGYINLALNIINEDLNDIKDVNLELEFEDDKLNLSHIKPHYNRLNNKFIIGDIKSHSGKYIEIYFDPLSCSKTIISGKVSYKTLNDYEKHIPLSPQTIRILSPELSTEETIRLIELNNLLSTELKYNGAKVITIPLGVDLDDLHKICKELAFKFNVRLIEELTKEHPQRVETWFYGTTKDQKDKFAIKIRLDDDTDSLEIFVASSNNPAITGLLADIFFNLSNELQERGITQQPLRPMDNLALKENIITAKRCLYSIQLDKLEKNLNIDMARQMKVRSRPLGEKFDSISRKELVGITKYRHDNVKAQKGTQGRADHSW